MLNLSKPETTNTIPHKIYIPIRLIFKEKPTIKNIRKIRKALRGFKLLEEALQTPESGIIPCRQFEDCSFHECINPPNIGCVDIEQMEINREIMQDLLKEWMKVLSKKNA